MLTLKRRTCRIGSSINTRAEHHGEDEVTALDIPLSGIMLEAEELNALLCDPHAHNLLFATKRSAPAEPTLGKLKALKLDEKIEGADVVLSLAGDNELKIVNCKLKGATLERELGGLTSLSVTVQCVPKLDSMIARLMEKLDREVEVYIRVDGYGDQAKLPLEHKAEDKAGADISRTGRRIAATVAKRKRAKNGHAEAR